MWGYKRRLRRESWYYLMGAWGLLSVLAPFTHLAQYLSNYFHCPPATKTQLLGFPSQTLLAWIHLRFYLHYLASIYGIKCVV